MNIWQRRGMRWTFLGFLLLVLALTAGRMGQVHLDSRLQGARGPYLQMPAPDGMTVRWQSLEPTRGVLRYGTAPDKLEQRVEGPLGTIHELRLSGLKPDSRYYYSVGETVHAFHTAPLPTSSRPLRLWVQGDPGRAIPSTMQGRDAAMQWAADHPREGLPSIDLWLTTGDNAYRSGKDEEFQQHLFDAYPKLLPTVPYLPVHGNHDARRNTFYRLFTFPTQGESGGLPSGSEHYFAIDYGQLHLIFLDTHDGDLDKTSTMLQWLQRDLAATRQPWIIAFMHHPPYTKGSHDSDDDGDSRGRMRQVRENVVPLLEQGGVAVALFGHSHVYERSHPIACHYGESESFEPTIIRQPNSGTIYNVVGSSAYADRGELDHPAMAVAKSELGSLMIDVTAESLTGYFINPLGAVVDQYRIIRQEGRRPGLGPNGCQ